MLNLKPPLVKKDVWNDAGLTVRKQLNIFSFQHSGQLLLFEGVWLLDLALLLFADPCRLYRGGHENSLNSSHNKQWEHLTCYFSHTDSCYPTTIWPGCMVRVSSNFRYIKLYSQNLCRPLHDAGLSAKYWDKLGTIMHFIWSLSHTNFHSVCLFVFSQIVF